MKRKIQKLSLTKETLRSLEDPKLSNVAGGVTATCVGVDTCPINSCNNCTDVTRKCSVCCSP
jgi:hypothetical protein